MTKTVLLKTGIGMLFLLYPFTVYIGLQTFDPKWLAGFLMLLTALRLVTWRGDSSMGAYWLVPAGLVLLATFITGSTLGLYLYPVMINLIFFSFFFISLYRPPTIIERFARQFDPDLSPAGIQYTRIVTKVWCVFFLINGSLALGSLRVSEQCWLLYNGFISYCLMG